MSCYKLNPDSSTCRLHPLSLAISLALAGLAQPLYAAPAAAHWTVTDLGTLGGSNSFGLGINNAGQVAGYAYTTGNAAQHGFQYSNGSMTDLGSLGGTYSSGISINNTGQITGSAYTAGNTAQHAFLYSNGGMADLGTLGGTTSVGFGISNAGQVTGYAYTTGNTAQHAFLYSNGSMTDLGTFGGTYSQGNGINNVGQVTGYATTSGNAAQHAFLYSNGSMTDLGTFGGTSSQGNGINNAGQVTGFATTTGNATNHAFLYSYGSLTDLGTLGGSSSYGYGINNAGQVTGFSYTAGIGAQHAFLYSNGSMTDLNSLPGVAGSGWTLAEGRGINDLGQITGYGTNAGVPAHAYVLALDTTVWEYGYSAGWDYSGGWSYLVSPNSNTHVIIDPVRSLTVSGPAGNASVKRLTIGTDASGGGGIATLSLNGGTIAITGDNGTGGIGWQGAQIGKNGVLTGDGALSVNSGLLGSVVNYGTILANNVRVQGSNLSNALIDNHGLIAGNTTGPAKVVSTYLTNEKDGRIQVLTGERLTIQAATGNFGSIEVMGGQLTHVGGGELINNSALSTPGRIVAQNALLTFQTGLRVSGGVLAVSAGNNNVFGTVTVDRSVNDNRGGQIILSGNSQTTFYDAVDIKSGAELRVSTGSTGVFFGQVFQRTGSLFTGTGSKFYEGGLSVGASPGLGSDGGDVTFGAGNQYLAEIGGTTAGTGFDFYAVAGKLSFGGTLKLVSWNSFVAQAGQRFDLFDGGILQGTFDNIDSTGFLLAAGTRLDTSRLYLDGSISVQAVPEPQSYAMLLAGLGLIGLIARRRRQGAAVANHRK
jgi:probable HAF family extracellular repeat protein